MKLDQLPDRGTIRAFKGKVDFYIVRGQAIARKWPKKPQRFPTAGERAYQQHLAAADEFYTNIDFNWKRILWHYGQYGGYTSRDIFMKHFFGTYAGVPDGLRWGDNGPSSVPFPDTVGRLWAVQEAYQEQLADQDAVFKAKVSHPGTYILKMYLGPLKQTWVDYKRRGVTFRGGPAWTFLQGNSRSRFATAVDGVVTFPLSGLYSLGPTQSRIFRIFKYTGTIPEFERGFSPAFGYVFDDPTNHSPADLYVWPGCPFILTPRQGFLTRSESAPFYPNSFNWPPLYDDLYTSNKRRWITADQ